jgi:ubiquinone/menaquinone biosynthesis C-methylase UbiE
VVCDLENKLPFEDDTFDVATSFFVLEHIANLK